LPQQILNKDNNAPEHALSINTTTLAIWCYKCDEELVYNSNNGNGGGTVINSNDGPQASNNCEDKNNTAGDAE
jgi:uncharacterized UBP type Zn finger protein